MILMKQQKETFDKICKYLEMHPEIYEEITEKYLEKNNIVNVKDVNLGNSNPYKPRAIYKSYCSHDCETWYECPACHKNFGSWAIFHSQQKCCPECKTELSGLD